MPCNFISSCFFLDVSPWNRDPDCVVVAGAPQQQGQQGQPGPWQLQQGNNDEFELPTIEHQPVNMAAVATAQQQNGATDGKAKSSANGETVPKTIKTFRAYLPSCHRTYSCVHCRAHLANHDELISKSFQGSQGRAYLFNSVVNIGCGPAEERVLLTGLHAVADIYCDCCKTTLGWKYEQAFESSQKYKEGKYIIELAHMIKENGWENESWKISFPSPSRGAEAGRESSNLWYTLGVIIEV